MKNFIEVHEIGTLRSTTRISVRHIRTYEVYEYKDYQKDTWEYGTRIKLYAAEYLVEESPCEIKQMIEEASK